MAAFVMVREYDERYVRAVSPNMWVSVLHRMTGFGWMEWETAICTKEPPACNIVAGDRRTELEGLTEAETLAWYAAHSGEKNSFETILTALSVPVACHGDRVAPANGNSAGLSAGKPGAGKEEM